jgi:PilZ domain-containing protein
VSYYRRATPRAEAEEGVYAFWSCDGPGDLSRVRNLNMGGIFIETPFRKDLGASVELYFLVREGQIRANAVVRHAEPGHGLGLKFTTLGDQDRLRFGALMKRLYAARCAVAHVSV